MMNKKKLNTGSETPVNSQKNLYFIRPQKAKLFSYHSHQSSNVSTANTRFGYNRSTENITLAPSNKLTRNDSAPSIHYSQPKERTTSVEKNDNYEKIHLTKIQINQTQQTIQLLKGKLAYERNQLQQFETQLRLNGIKLTNEKNASPPKTKLSSQDTMENLLLKQKVRDLITKLQLLDEEYEKEKSGIEDILLFKTSLMEGSVNNYMLQLKRTHKRGIKDRTCKKDLESLNSRFQELEQQLQFMRSENYHEKLQIDITEELHEQLEGQKQEYDRKLEKLKEVQEKVREKYARLSYDEVKMTNKFTQLFYQSRDRRTNKAAPCSAEKQLEELTKAMTQNTKQIEQLKVLDQQHQYSVIKGIQDIQKEIKISKASRDLLQSQIDGFQDKIFITHKVLDHAHQSDLSNNVDSFYQLSNA